MPGDPKRRSPKRMVIVSPGARKSFTTPMYRERLQGLMLRLNSHLHSRIAPFDASTVVKPGAFGSSNWTGPKSVAKRNPILSEPVSSMPKAPAV